MIYNINRSWFIAAISMAFTVFVFCGCAKKDINLNSKNSVGKTDSTANNGNPAGGNTVDPSTFVATVSTFAGTPDVIGFQNDGPLYATFNSPSSVAIDAAGNVYVTDSWNHDIREITFDGHVSTLSGTGHSGSLNGPVNVATFNEPKGIAVDAAGNIYIADTYNNLIRKITTAGIVSTLAGTGQAGAANGAANVATFNLPYDIAIDKNGVIFVADYGNNLIRKIDANGNVTTLAGTGQRGTADGPASSATLTLPVSLVVDPDDNIYVAALVTGHIREISSAGQVSTLDASSPSYQYWGLALDAAGNLYASATPNTIMKINTQQIASVLVSGSFTISTRDVSQTEAFNDPQGLAVDSKGNVFVADNVNNIIREITPGGQVSNFAGSGNQGSANNQPAEFYFPTDVALDASGNVFVADVDNSVIREISPTAFVSTFEDHYGLTFNKPLGVKTDQSGNLYVADWYQNKILKVSAAGVVSTFAGSGGSGASNGPATTATFSQPRSVAVDNAGNVYVADSGNNLVRKITPAGVVSTLAGTGAAGQTNGAAASASFKDPFYLALDAAGNIYVADAGNDLIRKITPAGMVSIFAGSGVSGSADGQSIKASFNIPAGLAVDAAGDVYVSDCGNNLIRVISAGGAVSTLAGSGTAGSADGVARSASFNHPCGLTLDAAGNLYVADEYNDVIRKITIAK